MSIIRILPNEKAIAFGGVATGSIKAKEVDNATGNITYNGLFPVLSACIEYDKAVL